MFKKVLAALWLFLAAYACAEECGNLAAGDYRFNVNHDGLSRQYLLHVPRGFVSGSVALVVAWHGLTHTPSYFEDMTKYSILADQTKNFIVAYPAGEGESFNAGSCCSPAMTRRIDDYGFARTLVKDVSSRICIDSNKVYTTGYSNGCFMSQGLICKAGDIFKASACGSGAEVLLTDCDDDYYRFNASTNVLEIHGTTDAVVPYNGNALLGFPPVLETYADHRRRLACTAGPTVTYQKGNAKCEQYTKCRGGAKVEQCTIQRGTHDWFDTADMDNSEYILKFFGLL